MNHSCVKHADLHSCVKHADLHSCVKHADLHSCVKHADLHSCVKHADLEHLLMNIVLLVASKIFASFKKTFKAGRFSSRSIAIYQQSLVFQFSSERIETFSQHLSLSFSRKQDQNCKITYELG